MIILDIDYPRGCFECECRVLDHFDGNEFHYFCPFIKTGENTYKEVFDDGERDEDCLIKDEITEKEYRLIKSHRKIKELEERRRQWRKEHGLPETPKPTYNDDFGTPACTEDGEYLVGGEPDDYYDKKEKK